MYLKNIVTFDEISAEKIELAQSVGLTVYHFNDVVKAGIDNPTVDLEVPQPNDVVIFCYTSGTTGDPKGAMLTHQSTLATIHMLDHFEFTLGPDDSRLSYLPYAHAFEQIVFMFTLTRGSSHGYNSGDPLLLLQDL